MTVEGITYVRAVYTGMSITSPNSVLRYEVKADRCPTFGETGALLIEPNEEGRRVKTKRLTLFCPFTLTANSISPTAAEICEEKAVRTEVKIEGAKQPRIDVTMTAVQRPTEELDEERIERLSKFITKNWEMRCRLNLPCDLDVAALVLQRMGKPIPEVRQEVKLDADGKVKETGGKQAEASLKTAVNRESKPGLVLTFYLDGQKSILEGMAEFGATRSALLSNLHSLWRNNGIGYSLAADMVAITLPEGCDDPFIDPPKKADKKQKETKVAEDKPRGKPLGDAMLFDFKLPEKGKRREVALATWQEPVEISVVALKVGCSEGSVRSHINDLHIKHGFGYTITGPLVKMIVPEGWAP